MQSVRTILCLSGLSATLILSETAVAQESKKASQESEQSQQVNDWAKATVGRLKFKNVTHDRNLELKPGSLLRWSNPIAGNVYGDSYLWMDQGRPAAFLSIYAMFDTPEGNRRLTFQSLSADKLAASVDDQPVWQPQSSAIEFTDLANSTLPPERVAIQKIHMRRIATQFSAQIAEAKDGERFRSLRLLTAPLLQYQSPENNIQNGQLFAFVDGTDPELLLLVEAFVKGNRRNWRYAAVRQNHRRLQLLHNQNVVWEAPALAPPFPNPKISDPSGVYFNTRWSNIATSEK